MEPIPIKAKNFIFFSYPSSTDVQECRQALEGKADSLRLKNSLRKVRTSCCRCTRTICPQHLLTFCRPCCSVVLKEEALQAVEQLDKSEQGEKQQE